VIHRFVDLQAGIVAYMRMIFDGTNSYNQIWAVPSAGGAPMQVTSSTTDGTIDSDPDVSPDGSQVVFLRATGFGSPKLYIVNADGSGLTLLDNNTGCAAPMWSPDGTKILYRRATGFRTVLPDGTGNTAITIIGPTGDAGIAHPTWNRDATKIAFHSAFSSALTPDELWICDADGSNAAKISDATRGGLGGLGISWAHGADVIAFVERISSNNHVSIINADGTGKTQLTSAAISPGLTKYAWSTDDSTIFATRQVTPWSLYQVPAAGGGESAVSPTLEMLQTVGRGQPFVHGNRIYTIRRTTADLVSVLFDGSDLRVEDTPDLVGPDFIDLALSGNGTEL
jgi:dipeptidyl aminopeptidase/acylaminoacyl peptidase